MIDDKKLEPDSSYGHNNNNTNNDIKEINLKNRNDFSYQQNTSTPRKQSKNVQQLQQLSLFVFLILVFYL